MAIIDLGEGGGYIAPRRQPPTEALRPARVVADGETMLGGQEGPGVVPSAIITGLTDIPLAGTLFEGALTHAFGVNKAALEEMAEIANSEPYGKGLKFVTEMGGELLMGAGAWSLGRRALLAGLRSAVPQGMAALAAPTATGGRVATSLGRVAARAMDTAGGSPELRALGIFAPVPKPVVERGAEILGGSLGMGGFSGASELEEGGNMGDALRAAAWSAALAGGAETAFTLGAKALFPGAREVDLNKLLANTRGTPMYRQTAKLVTDKLNQQLTKTRQRVVDLHGQGTVGGRKLYTAETRAVKAATESSAFDYFTNMSPLFRSYLRELPRDRASAVQTILLKLAKTPEQTAGELGPSVAGLVHLARTANLETSMARSINNVELRAIDRTAREGLGAWRGFGFRGRRGGEYLIPSLTRWQRTGDPVVAGTTNPSSLRKAFYDLEVLLTKAEDDLAKVGLGPPPGMRGGRGVKQMPLVLNRLEPTQDLLGRLFGRPKSDEALVKELSDALVKTGRHPLNADQLARRVVFGERNESTRTVFSMFDETSINDLFPDMTFEEVLATGAPIVDDPIVAVEAYMNSVARRVAYAQRFGPNGSLAIQTTKVVPPMKQMAIAEGASSQLYDQVAEAVLGGSWGTTASQALAAAVTNTQTATRMAFGVLPNMWQWVNTPLVTGPSSMVRGLLTRFQKGNPIYRAAEASAIHDSMIRSFRESFLDPYFRTPMGKFADTVLLSTGFTWAERWNRLWAFHASANYGMKTLTQAAEGRLRGNALDIARRRFNGMGQDLDDLVRSARAMPGGTTAEKVESLLLSNDMAVIKDIGLGGVRQTQFLPDKTRLPTFWNSPAGRVAFQFKSFALSQTRLIRDHVVNEAAKGNMEPILYMMGVFPLGGEVTYDLRQIIKDGELKRSDSPLLRFVENSSAIGGFGIASDIFKAANWGPEQVVRLGVGPTVEDMAYLVSSILSNDYERTVDRVAKLPTFQAALSLGTVGLGAAMVGIPKLRDALTHFLVEDVEEAEVAPLTLQELGTQQRAQ